MHRQPTTDRHPWARFPRRHRQGRRTPLLVEQLERRQVFAAAVDLTAATVSAGEGPLGNSVVVAGIGGIAHAALELTAGNLQATTFAAGATVATFTGDSVELVTGADAYEIVGTAVRLRAAWTPSLSSPLPTFGVRDAKGATAYLVTKHFAVSDDLQVRATTSSVSADPILLRNSDGTGSFFSSAYLKTSITGVADGVGDRVVAARLQAFMASATSGTIQCFGLADARWSEATFSLAANAVALGQSTAYGPTNLPAGLLADHGDVVVSGVANRPISFDLGASAGAAGSRAFMLVSGDGPAVSHTVFARTTAGYAPFVSVSYVTESPLATTDDVAVVREAASTMLQPVQLLANDPRIDASAPATIASINGVAWSTLAVSTSDTYNGAFGYRQVAGDRGTLYVLPSGQAVYEHSGANTVAPASDAFDYRFENAGYVSRGGRLTVTVTPANQRPALRLRERNFRYANGTSGAAAGDVAATVSATDPDGDPCAVVWTNGTAPRSSSGADLYAIDALASAVRLTAAGAAALNAGNPLPAISVAAVDRAGLSDLATVTPFVARGRVFYVDQVNGDDGAAGTSLAAAYRSFESVASLNGGLKPGDTVYIVGRYSNGTYAPTWRWNGDVADPYVWRDDATIKVYNVNGTAAAPITIKGWDEHAVLLSDSTAGVIVGNSRYVNVVGLEVDGIVNDLTHDQISPFQFLYRVANTTVGYVRADYESYPGVIKGYASFIKSDAGYDYFWRVPPTSTVSEIETTPALQVLKASATFAADIKRVPMARGEGVVVRASQYVNVTDNHVHHVASAGIRSQGSEYVTIVGNRVHDATRFTFSGTMGLTVSDTLDTVVSEGDYKVVVANNEVFRCYNEFFSWVATKTFMTPHLDEGKGISMEWQDNASWTASGATGRILLAQNVTWLNGLSGVNNHAGDRVDMIYNTSYLNSLYESVLAYDAGLNVGVTTEAEGTPNLGYGSRLVNNLSIVDGSVGGYAVRAMATFRGTSTPTLCAGSGNVTGTVTGGTILYDPANLSLSGFFAKRDVNLAVTPVLQDPGTADFRVVGGTSVDGIVSSPLGSPGWTAATLASLLVADARGAIRDLRDPGALSSFSVTVPAIAITGVSDATVAENSPFTSACPAIMNAMGAVTWSLEGPDAAGFAVHRLSGVVSMVARDHELPADSDRDNVYRYVLRATDAAGRTAAVSLAVTVTDVADPATPIRLDVAAGSDLIDNTVHSGAVQLVKAGGGRAILAAANSHTGGVSVQQGTVLLRSPGALGSGRLEVAAGARVTIDGPGLAVSVSALTLDPLGAIDIGRGRVTVTAANPAVLRDRLVSGYSSGWSGDAGIVSAAAAVDGRTIGFMSGDDGSFTVSYAVAGDTNLDGIVDVTDLATFLSAGLFDQTIPAGWSEGDFNYDGIVDLLDAVEFLSAAMFDAGSYGSVGSAADLVAADVPTSLPLAWEMLVAAAIQTVMSDGGVSVVTTRPVGRITTVMP